MDLDFRLILLRIPPILFALTIHEFAHAYAAHLCGDDTAKMQGRLTFNPLVHLDPIGALCFVFVGFGWAKPVPVNPDNFSSPRRDDILVSVAGVTANLATAMAVAILMRATVGLDMWHTKAGAALWNMSFLLCRLSLVLLIFNLIPLPPLDGSHVLRNLLPARAAASYQAFTRVAPFVLMILVFSGGIGLILGPPLRFLADLLLGPAGFMYRL